MAWGGPPVTGVIAALALIGATTMALTGTIDGSDAVSLYALVMGYVFGFRVGTANANNKRGSP